MTPSVQQIGEGLIFFQRGWLNGNHLASLGRETILIDSGYLGSLSETLSLLRQTGIEPARVDRIITTHVHCDHVGAHAFIHEASGARVELSQQCRLIIDRKDGWAAWPSYYQQEYRFFPTHETINDNQMISINGINWQALEAPGHAAGQLCFFAPDTGWLISADAVWNGDFGVINLVVEGHDAARQQQKTLQKLAALPVSRIIPGHGSLIEDGRGAIQKCLARVERYIAEPERIWVDQMRKIILYTLMMHQPMEPERLKALLEKAPWVLDACKRFFNQNATSTTDRFVNELIDRGLILEVEGGLLVSALPE